MYSPIPRNWLLASNKIEVTFSNGTKSRSAHASGFWTRHQRSGQDLFFVTNRHIVDAAYNKPDLKSERYELDSLEILNIAPPQNSQRLRVRECRVFWPQNPKFDIAVLAPRISQSQSGDAKHLVQPIDLDIMADKGFLQDGLEWGDMITFCSYQPWQDAKGDWPIVRTGWLASDPVRPLAMKEIKNDCIHLLEAFSFAGSSGAPVFANARGIKLEAPLMGGGFRDAKLIGIMSGHLTRHEEKLNRIHPGLSWCHRSDLLLSIMRNELPLEVKEIHLAVVP